MDVKFILVCVAIVAAIAVYVVAREKINLRKAAGGGDRERLEKAVAQALPGEGGYQVAYGHYEKVEQVVRKTITTYFCYALAFDATRIWVIPLDFDRGAVLPGKPVLVTGDVRITNGKEGRVRRVDCSLYDKNGASILDCVVEASNTKDDRFHPVNITQEEECARFGWMIESMADRANRENAGLREQVHAAAASARKAHVFGMISAAFALLPPIGIALGVAGLRHAKKSRVGNQLTVDLVLCRTALVINSIFAVLEVGLLIYLCLIKGLFG